MGISSSVAGENVMRSRQRINDLYKQEDAKRKVPSEGGKQNSVSLTKDGAKAGGRGAATKLGPLRAPPPQSWTTAQELRHVTHHALLDHWMLTMQFYDKR